jgi:tetratricopeptide (TPR) repeat protein
METVFERAFALHQKGRLAEAEPLYLQVLQGTPGDFAAQLLLGVLRGQQGRNQQALELLAAALAIDPYSDLALLNQGNVLAAMGRTKEALASYDRALVAHPGHADLRNARGLLLVSLRRFEAALTDLDAALAIRPDFAQAWNNRGNALQGLKQFAEALDCYDRALALHPSFPQGHNNRANALRRLGRFPEALAATDHALALEPGNAQSLNDRGNVLQDMNRLDEAIASYDGALALRSDYPDALNNRGTAWAGLMRFDAALADFESAIAHQPEAAQAYWSKGVALMRLGDLAQGLRLYEWRKKLPAPIEARNYRQPHWTGAEDLTAKTLFLYIEQGLGDTIHFYRYALLARARGARVILSVQDPIVRLLQDADADIEILGAAEVPQNFDYHAPLMSLALAFATTLAAIPAPIPYLRADPRRVKDWAARIGRNGASARAGATKKYEFKIGICWQGAASIAGRSFPLVALAPISQIENVRLISLQKDGAAEIAAAGLRVEDLGDDFDTGRNGFLDSAAVMESLDLVITADTALAHLAGALGRPAWVALRYVPDWRWFLGRSDSPWYPQLRLFRQPAPGDWTAIVAEMEAQLRAVHLS